MSPKKLTTPRTTDNSLSPSNKWYGNCLVFKESCLKQKAQLLLLLIEKFFIASDLDTWSRDLNPDFTLKDCLFGGVKLAANADPEKYVYGGFGIAFY